MATEAETDQGERRARTDDDLLERLAAIALALAEAETFEQTIQRVVDLAQQFLEHCDGASLMLIGRGGHVDTPACSSETAFANDQAQYKTHQGPCMDAIADHQTIILEDLRTEERWPEYRLRALELGVRSMISFRLFASEDTIGALNLFSRRPYAFDRHAEVIGQVFATHASVAVKAALTEAGYETALRSRDVIGQAKGILMARHRMTADMAFQLMKSLSQDQNRPIRELAVDITRTGTIARGSV
jgi:transcriptional regulator with GAF, ATPase, and Fis domain